MVETPTLLFFGGLLIGLLVGVIIFLYFKSEKRYADDNIMINFNSHRTNGRFIGRELSAKKLPSGRWKSILRAYDINLKDIILGKKIDDETLISDYNKRFTLSKGSPSKDRNITITFPKNASEFDKELLNTPFGKVLALYTEMQNMDNAEIESFKIGLERGRRHIVEMAQGEMTVERWKMLEGMYKDMFDSMKDSKKDKPSSFAPPTFGQNN